MMAQQHRQPPVQAKDEPYDHRNLHAPPPHLQHPRPPSIVHQQHHSQAQASHSQHQSPYSVYQPPSQAASNHNNQDIYDYHNSPYNTAPAAPSGYASADMMAATMSRPPYPPISSYHTPQSTSPASVASGGGHDQQRSIYAQPPQMQQPLYYAQQHQYHSLPPTAAPSPYGQHTQAPHQSMTSQSGMMLSHGAPSPVQHQMSQHPGQHPGQHPSQHPGQHSPIPAMGSPRHAKMEVQSLTPQLGRQGPPQAPSPLSMGQMHQQHQQHPQHPQPQHSQHQQQSQQHAPPPHQQQPQHASHSSGTSPLPAGPPSSGGGSSVVNPNAAPGPIPATTPLVVRQDQNGVQWIAFEYSRDRVKLKYTIRCDVESVSTDELSAEFKQENCVYPRACCPREQYRGNRLQYESECNTVGWALAQLNQALRGKRGLIQRAVDSWRNSNQDPRLRSRRVRRMAKMGTRKAASSNMAPSVGSVSSVGHPSPVHLGPSPLPSAGAPLAKSLHALPPPMHPHGDGSSQQGGNDVGESDESYLEENQHHHHQASLGGSQDSRPAHVFSSYGGYPGGAPLPAVTPAVTMTHSAVSSGLSSTKKVVPQPDGLFPDLPEAKKRKFVLVEDRGSRLRVRVTLNTVDTSEIPDSFRRSNAVYPDSFFPSEMESPPPSPTGRRFFTDDLDDVAEDLRLDAEDDGRQEVEASSSSGSGSGSGSGGGGSRPRQHQRLRRLANTTTTVRVPGGSREDADDEAVVPRMRKGLRRKQVRLNDLGCRMAWLQSRAFAGRRIFLQKALDTYRSKTCNGILASMQDVADIAPHYEMRVGKKKWLSCERAMELRRS